MPVDVLASTPLFRELPPARLDALARAGAVEQPHAGPVAPEPPSTLRVLLDGALSLVVMPHRVGPGVVADPNPDLLAAARAAARPLTPGDVLPCLAYPDRPPLLDLRAEPPVEWLRLSVEAQRAVAEDPAWRRRAPAWWRLVDRLQFASILATCEPVRRLGPAERALLAGALRWRRVSAGERLSAWGERADAVFVPGHDAVLEVVVADQGEGPLTLLPQGVGSLVGVSAFASDRAARRYRVRATVVTGSRVAVLSHAAFRRLAARNAPIRQLGHSQASTIAQLSRLIGALGSSPLFRLMLPTADILAQILLTGTEVVWRVGNHPPAVVDQEGIAVVSEGEIIRHVEVPEALFATAPSRCLPVATARAFDTCGEAAFVNGESAALNLAPRVPTRLLMVDKLALASIVAASPNAPVFLANRAALSTRLTRAEADRSVLQSAPDRPKDVTFIVANPHLPTVQARVAQLTAEVATRFGESTHVLAISNVSPLLTSGLFTWRALAPFPDPFEVLLDSLTLVAPASGRLQRLFVLVDPALSSVRLGEAVNRIVHWHEGPTVAWPRATPATPSVFAAFIDPGVGMTDPGPTPFPPATVRFHVAAGAPLDAKQTARLARAVTDRRVGVAFGGGGGLAYSHLAVLKAIDKKIPIDATSGVSFGTVVACYWAHHDNYATPEMVSHRLRLQISVAMHALSGRISERLMDRFLNHIRVEEIEASVFPMAGDIVTGSLAPLLRGTVGACIRASGGFAPFFPATPGGRRSYVDGGLIANVPSLVLQQEGLRLIIASDAVAPPATRPLHADVSGLPLPWWLQDLLVIAQDLGFRRRIGAGLHGFQALVNSAGEMAAQHAGAHFESETLANVPIWLMDPWTVINTATGDPGFADAKRLAIRRWKGVEAPI